jgi:drug/metabolite transporter (DMT)-like permease
VFVAFDERIFNRSAQVELRRPVAASVEAMNRSALLALTAAGLMFGLTVPLSKVALGWLDPAWLAAARFGLAAPVGGSAAWAVDPRRLGGPGRSPYRRILVDVGGSSAHLAAVDRVSGSIRSFWCTGGATRGAPANS